MDICTCNPRKHGTFFINGRLICIYCRQPIADDTIADLEAANILLTRTINEQAQVIREHEAADVIAVEAIRAQAAEIAMLKEKVRYAYVQIAALEKEDDDDYRYAQQKNFD